ncbi:hypothetical protein L209DRAFT_519922 [Thermothelomyces heterothallicus CBS 203.75]
MGLQQRCTSISRYSLLLSYSDLPSSFPFLSFFLFLFFHFSFFHLQFNRRANVPELDFRRNTWLPYDKGSKVASAEYYACIPCRSRLMHPARHSTTDVRASSHPLSEPSCLGAHWRWNGLPGPSAG